MLHYAKIHYAILHYGIKHYAILCYAILLYTIMHYAILHYGVLQYSILNYSILHYANIHCSKLHYTMPCYTICLMQCFPTFFQPRHTFLEPITRRHTAFMTLNLGIVHKKSGFWPPPPVHMRPHGPDPLPLVDVHTRPTWNTHRSLEMASTMTYTGPKAEIRLYDSNLFKLYF